MSSLMPAAIVSLVAGLTTVQSLRHRLRHPRTRPRPRSPRRAFQGAGGGPGESRWTYFTEERTSTGTASAHRRQQPDMEHDLTGMTTFAAERYANA
jgi:hypothetical protein